MANAAPPNLLEVALDGKGSADCAASPSGGRMILVEDCVETSGTFVLHHLLKRCLFPHSSEAVVFLAFAQPFSHYDRILRKMGCNMSAQRDNRRLLFFDMLLGDRIGRNQGKKAEDILIALYGEVHKAIEVLLSHEEGKRHTTLIIDDVSLMEIDVKGSSNLVLDFLRYCYSLTSQYGCSLIALYHDDVFPTTDQPSLLLQLEYLADVVIKVEPLATGLAADVHGQLTVTNKGLQDIFGKPRNKVHNFQFQVKDSGIEYFYPGSKT